MTFDSQLLVSPAFAAVLGSTILLGAPALGQNFGGFAPPIQFDSGGAPDLPPGYIIGDPIHVIAADLTGNGTLDLAVANQYSNTVSILRGNGDAPGTFQPQQQFEVGYNPMSVAAGDLNGNGFLDLVVANSAASTTVSVLLGNGDGTFQPHQQYEIGSNARTVVIADMNGDDVPDLVVANYGSSNVSILLGNGDGTFQPQLVFNGAGPADVDVGDLNGNGTLDVVTANQTTSSVSVFLGNGNGTLQPHKFTWLWWPEQHHPVSVAVGDLNGNGVQDVATANWLSGTVGVLLGNGDGTLQLHDRFDTGASPRYVAIGDLNMNGIPDLVTTNDDHHTVSVLLGNESPSGGMFQPQQEFLVGGHPQSAAIADLNGDGVPDVVAASWSDSAVTVLINLTKSPTPGTCPADLTGSGSVGVPDLLQLLSCWGGVNPECDDSDLTGSGTVGVPDLLALLANWGDCPR